MLVLAASDIVFVLLEFYTSSIMCATQVVYGSQPVSPSEFDTLYSSY